VRPRTSESDLPTAGAIRRGSRGTRGRLFFQLGETVSHRLARRLPHALTRHDGPHRSCVTRTRRPRAARPSVSPSTGSAPPRTPSSALSSRCAAWLWRRSRAFSRQPLEGECARGDAVDPGRRRRAILQRDQIRRRRPVEDLRASPWKSSSSLTGSLPSSSRSRSSRVMRSNASPAWVSTTPGCGIGDRALDFRRIAVEERGEAVLAERSAEEATLRDLPANAPPGIAPTSSLGRHLHRPRAPTAWSTPGMALSGNLILRTASSASTSGPRSMSNCPSRRATHPCGWE